MEEINKKTLIEALSSLKEYEPPSSLWENINMELELGRDEIVSKEMLMDLPEHDPPESVWNNVSQRLDQNPKVRRLAPGWKRGFAVAASLALLFCANYFINSGLESHESESISLTYSTETIDDQLLVNDWEQDEEAFAMYKELCNAKKYICEHPEFQVLQREFDELSEAVKELEFAIGDFGADANLISQIKEIELERTDLFKKMMVMLV